jgi:hypothetical protein
MRTNVSVVPEADYIPGWEKWMFMGRWRTRAIVETASTGPDILVASLGKLDW